MNEKEVTHARAALQLTRFKVTEDTCLQYWKLPSSYFGATWEGYVVGLAQSRDSDVLTRSNFISFLAAIGGESETVIVVRESHWACGWVEWIAIDPSDEAACNEAEEILRALEDYPVVNEDHYSELEWDEASDYWSGMSIRDRIYVCKRFGESIFAARRDTIPQDNDGSIMQYLSSP